VEHQTEVAQLKQQAADVLKACKQTVAAGDKEIKRLTTDHSTQVESLQTSHAAELENLKLAHSAEVETVRSEYLLWLESMKQQHAAELESIDASAGERAQAEFGRQLELIRKDHAAELERTRSAHAAELDRVQSECRSQLQAAQNDHEAALESVKSAHVDELGRLREDRQLAMEKHTAALAAEHQRTMNEQKAEMESMALNTASLQGELEQARSEAVAAFEMAEKTLASEFESRLAAAKQQFTEDMKDVEHRHAAELAERDAMISDVEAVLLAKETKLDELEQELNELRQHAARQVDQHADKVTDVERRHAEEVVSRNRVHAEEIDRLQSELDAKDDKIVELDGVISQGRLMIDRQKSDIAVCKKQLEEAASVNKQLQDENASLQRCLDQKTESLTTENADFEKQRQQLQLALESANTQRKTAEDRMADLQRELDRAVESVNDKEQKLAEQRKKTADVEEDLARYDKLCEREESKNTELRESYDRQQKKIAELQSQLSDCSRLEDERKKQIEMLEGSLAESTSACCRLEAERVQLRCQSPNDGELYRQLERLQSELYTKDNKIVELDGVISQGRLIIYRQNLDIADYEKRVEDAASANKQLCDENASLQKCLDQKADSLTVEKTRYENQCQHLQSALESASAQLKAAEDKAASLQCELERAAETVNGNEQKLEEQRTKIADLEEDMERFNHWGKDVQDRLSVFRVADVKQMMQIADLRNELTQSRAACSDLEAERDQLRRQDPSDSDLHRQLQEKAIECAGLKNRLEKERRDFEKKRDRDTAEIARLEEIRRKQQNTIRELQDAANVTYVQPSRPQPPPAAAAPEPARPSETDYVSGWCVRRYEAEMTRLQREQAEKDGKMEALSRRLDEYKTHLSRVRKERDALREKQNLEVTPAVSSQPQLPPPPSVTAVSDDAVADTNCTHQ